MLCLFRSVIFPSKSVDTRAMKNMYLSSTPRYIGGVPEGAVMTHLFL